MREGVVKIWGHMLLSSSEWVGWRVNYGRQPGGANTEPMKDVARMIRRHFAGVIDHVGPDAPDHGLIEPINGLFQAAKRKAPGYANFKTMRTVLFLIAGKLDFSALDPHAS